MIEIPLVQGQINDQSTTPGVATRHSPKIHELIMAGFIIAFRSRRSIVWNRSSVKKVSLKHSTNKKKKKKPKKKKRQLQKKLKRRRLLLKKKLIQRKNQSKMKIYLQQKKP